jgi:hypothetical protein
MELGKASEKFKIAALFPIQLCSNSFRQKRPKSTHDTVSLLNCR